MDLAGSERAANTKNTGARLIEGKNIIGGEGGEVEYVWTKGRTES